MSDNAILLSNIGKMYKLYKSPKDKLWDALGIYRWKKNFYKEFWALRNINLSIKKGEKVGIIGFNGAGKSTLLRLLIRAMQPTEGQLEVHGRIQALLEIGVGFHPEFTGRDNIRSSLAYQGFSTVEIAAKENDIIEFSELGEFIDQPVKTYSAGMYTRLAFSTSTAIEPDLLIVDEVLGAGDAYFFNKCVGKMKELAGRQGATVIIVSHDLSSIQALCDRVIWIDRGIIRLDGDPLEVIKEYTAAVHKKEEMRIRIREMQVAEEQAVAVDRDSDLYIPLLCRFVIDKKTNTELKVRKISLYNGQKLIDDILVGAPMDNDSNGRVSFLTDNPGVFNWGPVQSDSSGYFRYIGTSFGSEGIAPFQFSVPKTITDTSFIRMELIMDNLYESRIKVELFDLKENAFIDPELTREPSGILVVDLNGVNLHHEKKNNISITKNIDDNCENVEIISGINNSTELEQLSEGRDVQLIKGFKILGFDIYDLEGKSRRVFPFNNQLSKLLIRVKFGKALSHFYVSLLVYSKMGQIVSSVLNEVTTDNVLENQVLDFSFDFSNLKLGPGEYNITFSIYKELNVLNWTEKQEALVLIDRAMFFKIEYPLEYKLSIGIILFDAPMKISHKGKGISCISTNIIQKSLSGF